MLHKTNFKQTSKADHYRCLETTILEKYETCCRNVVENVSKNSGKNLDLLRKVYKVYGKI